ncbi:hypothetical protein OsJ_30473 [Oryza sativa Japonica Group]|uniref:Uncharacterized protein n=1 Tax=Oryza sativa subsp. japonica TaxID=39947 RepID=A3C1V0_ORYSJ|nr:hypothetical protein OsJ_30473 [Oryza sativa Japonica Group]
MDDHPGHLVYIPLLEFFRCRCCHNSSSRAVPPARAVKAALAEALVWYYPVAGRLREIAGGKLVVDCTAEGVAFVEADADVRLEELGEPLLPPFPCVEVLLCDAGDIGVVVGKPIVFLQVTEFKCGGFVMGFYISHCIADGFGMIQFIKAIVDIARGEQAPMVLPVWERHILTSRSPPPTIGATNTNTVKFSSVLKDSTSIDDDIMLSTPQESMVGNYFLFRPNQISALGSHVHEKGATTATRFELITAVILRCRTVALGYKTDHRVHLLFAAKSRRHRGDGKAKLDGTTEERVRSTVAFLASLRLRRSGGRFPALAFDKAYAVSDFTRLGEDGLDFGWAERVGGGVATPSFVSFHSRWKLVSSDGDGEEEEAVAALMLLPKPAMDRFDKELALWLDLDKPSVGGLCLSSKF